MKTKLTDVVIAVASIFAVSSSVVHADVTVTQKTNLEVASLISSHGGSSLSLTADKQREDTESHCEGVMSIVCGNLQGGEIVRLDRDLTWYLEPKKKMYREQVFATPAEIAAMRAKIQANLEKMNSCPVSQKQQPVDKSKCQMSPPKIDIHKTDDKLSIAGHDAQRTQASLTETCTNTDTGDVCETVIAIDIWLTQDSLPGSSERLAFSQAYARKLGIDESTKLFSGDVAKYLAPYQTQIKELQAKSADFKGQPLKTSLRVLVGGPHCGATSGSKADTTNASTSSASPSNPISNVNQAGKAVGNLIGGLFHKKKADESAAPASSVSPGAASDAPDPFAQLTQIGSFTIETVSINTDPIPAERFDVPANWTKEVPKAMKAGNDDYTCPKIDN